MVDLLILFFVTLVALGQRAAQTIGVLLGALIYLVTWPFLGDGADH